MLDRAWETWASHEVALMPMREAGYDPTCNGCRIEHRTSGKYIGTHTCEGARGLFRRPAPPTGPTVLTKPQWTMLGKILEQPRSGATLRFPVLRRLSKTGLVMFAGAIGYEATPAGRAAHAAQTVGGEFLREPKKKSQAA